MVKSYLIYGKQPQTLGDVFLLQKLQNRSTEDVENI